jgi:5-formaminoimidazole-4-carboxamide-1-beta-D-ribofuranosyl 5'-monophosphate synthetase
MLAEFWGMEHIVNYFELDMYNSRVLLRYEVDPNWEIKMHIDCLLRSSWKTATLKNKKEKD